jgi:hypothetical protein
VWKRKQILSSKIVERLIGLEGVFAEKGILFGYTSLGLAHGQNRLAGNNFDFFQITASLYQLIETHPSSSHYTIRHHVSSANPRLISIVNDTNLIKAFHSTCSIPCCDLSINLLHLQTSFDYNIFPIPSSIKSPE